MLKGLQYYSDDPGKVGQTFVRLEKDFDHHVHFCRGLSKALDILEKQPAKDFFQVETSFIAHLFHAAAWRYFRCEIFARLYTVLPIAGTFFSHCL
jgi:hypothetical protein